MTKIEKMKSKSILNLTQLSREEDARILGGSSESYVDENLGETVQIEEEETPL